jgi:hypothetical protein
MVERWRERWAALANERLAELDIDARIDHCSLEAQGITLELGDKPGRASHERERRRGERDFQPHEELGCANVGRGNWHEA